MKFIKEIFNKFYSKTSILLKEIKEEKEKQKIKGEEEIILISPLKDLGIVVVDMQDYFLGEKKRDKIIELINTHISLLNFAMKNNLQIIFLEYGGCGKTTEKLQEVVKGYKNIVVVKKNKNGGYSNSNLEKILSKKKVKKVLYTGVNKEACVRDTIKGGKNFVSYAAKDLMNQPEEVNDWFSENTKYFETHIELMNALG